MPYNLRKRPAPEPIETVIKKPRVKTKEPKVKETKVKETKVKETKVKETKQPDETKQVKDVKQVKEVKPVKGAKEVKQVKTTKRAKTEKAVKKPPKSVEDAADIEMVEDVAVDEDVKDVAVDEDVKDVTVDEDEKVAEVVTDDKVSKDKIKHQYSFGVDGCGELGLGKIGVTRKAPSQLPVADSIKEVACGPMHTITLTEDGKVYTFGCNDEGALGRITESDSDQESTPTLVPLPDRVVKVTAGDSHSAALTVDSSVFIWGNFRDEHGSTGLTPECNGEASFKPFSIPDIKVKDIASGSNHMLLLDTDGVVYSFGVGAQGQLGRLESKEVDENITAENRERFLRPKPVNLQTVDPNRPFICDAVFAGNNASFATNTDKKKNRLAGWGLNNYYQLGYKGQKGDLIQYKPKRCTFTCSTSMISVASGQHHTLFLTRTGRVYSAGRHDYGMLGLGKQSKEVCPAKRIDSLENITKIDAGINTSFAVSEDGKLYSWGMSGTQLGVPGETDYLEPTVVTNLEGKRVLSVSSEGEFTAVVAVG